MSITAPTAAALELPLQEWLRRESDRCYLSAISIAEIESGIEKARRTGALGRALRLRGWLDRILAEDADRLLAFDAPAARITGALLDRARALGLAPGFADLAIAGIAMASDLTLLTRNLRHFVPLGVPALDPYATLPG